MKKSIRSLFQQRVLSTRKIHLTLTLTAIHLDRFTPSSAHATRLCFSHLYKTSILRKYGTLTCDVFDGLPGNVLEKIRRNSTRWPSRYYAPAREKAHSQHRKETRYQVEMAAKTIYELSRASTQWLFKLLAGTQGKHVSSRSTRVSKYRRREAVMQLEVADMVQSKGVVHASWAAGRRTCICIALSQPR